MTTKDIPKHILPVAGIPLIVRLLESLSVFPQIVIAVAGNDTKTLTTLLETKDSAGKAVVSLVENSEDHQSMTTSTTAKSSINGTSYWELKSEMARGQKIFIVKLSDDCYGSLDALRVIEGTKLIDPETRIVMFPGDLVILKKNIKSLNALIRPEHSKNIGCTAILVDALEQDEHGLPLKESAKAKKGFLSRDKEDIEYIALSFPESRSLSSSWLDNSSDRNKSSLPRIVLKKSKLDIEDDEDMTGSTAKLVIPKSRLRGENGGEQLVIRTEWSDVHVYSLAPWVRQLIVARTKNFSSIQEDLIPLLISRQFRGKRATFGKSALASLANLNQSGDSVDSSSSSTPDNEDSKNDDASNKLADTMDDEPYSVSAVVLPAKTMLRANTVPAYLFACKEAVTNSGSDKNSELRLPKDSKRNGKFQTLTLDGSKLGSKISMKSSTVGRSCTLGDKCRLNNVVILDNVTIGEQCSLQNTIIGFGAKLGNNCSLNDCQVGPGVEIPPGTKEKGEPFVAGDIMDTHDDVIDSELNKRMNAI